MERLVIVIGTAKAGTTSLARWLAERPDVVISRARMAVKEPKFFTDFRDHAWTGPGTTHFRPGIPKSEEAYLANYAPLAPGQWAIDGSTDYLWAEGADERIADFAARRGVELRLICLTRDPFERAVSEYVHTRQLGMETLSFADSLAAEPRRIAERAHPLFYHRRRSRIAADIARFRARFGERLMVMPMEALKDHDAALARVAAFMGVEHIPLETAEVKNRLRMPRNRAAGTLTGNAAFRAMGRRLLPSGLRARMREALYVEARRVVNVPEAEAPAYLAPMADEVTACVASPDIDTRHWRSVEILAGQIPQGLTGRPREVAAKE